MNPKDQSPAQVIMTTRIIWAALLAGQIAFAVVTWVTVAQSPPAKASPADPRALLYIALAMLATVLPVAILLRSRITSRPGEELPARAYTSLNIASLAICEGQTFALLAFCIVTHQLMPFFGLAAVPMAVFLAMFPRNPGWKV